MPDIPPTKKLYDAREVVSALQKAIRRSDPDAAIYWAIELQSSGFGAWCWKRLRTITSEDIGPAAPGLAADVRALHDNWKQEQKSGQPMNGMLYIIHAVLAMCAAPKSRVVDNAAWAWHKMPRREIPDEALDGHTARGRQIGRGHKFFIEESSRLFQPGFTLAELEDRYFDMGQAEPEDEPVVGVDWS